MNEAIDLLQCRFGLTPAEARLALHLVAGETLRSAAVKLSISYETARIDPIQTEPGLIAYECPSCSYVTSVLTPSTGGSRERQR